MLIRKIKIPPTHICVIIMIMNRMCMRSAMWFVKTYKILRVLWFVVLNAIFFHFYLFHPYPSPRPGKYYHLKKRLQIALCGRIPLFYLYMIPNGVIFGIIEQKFEKWQIKNRLLKIEFSCACYLIYPFW